MSTYQITPLDTLFFRDGRPFSMEDDTMATGLFPPPPSVLYGLLRTASATDRNLDYTDLATQTKDVEISDIHYIMANEKYYLVPFDMVIDAALNLKKKAYPQASLLQLKERNPIAGVLSNTPFKDYDLEAPGYIQSAEGLYLSHSEWQNYRNGSQGPFTLFNPQFEENKLFYSESKIGIGRTADTHVTKDGRLYQINMRRLIDFSFCIETNFVATQRDTIHSRCGAEGKVVRFEKVEPLRKWEALKMDKEQYFKIVLTTPAFFEKGDQPTLSDLPAFKDFEIEILYACVGRKIPIGGFDMKERVPKRMKYAVPAGSVYYCKIKNAKSNLKNLVQHDYFPNSISACRGREGFGLFQIAKMNIDFIQKSKKEKEEGDEKI